VQQLINRRLAQAGVVFQYNIVLNYLDTVIAMVEAGEGIAVIPSFAMPACRNRRVVMSQLTNPIVSLDFYQITNRGRKLPIGADDFTSFLKWSAIRKLETKQSLSSKWSVKRPEIGTSQPAHSTAW
jgi:LysR family carnitine catabolism transcriptional activator